MVVSEQKIFSLLYPSVVISEIFLVKLNFPYYDQVYFVDKRPKIPYYDKVYFVDGHLKKLGNVTVTSSNM